MAHERGPAVAAGTGERERSGSPERDTSTAGDHSANLTVAGAGERGAARTVIDRAGTPKETGNVTGPLVVVIVPAALLLTLLPLLPIVIAPLLVVSAAVSVTKAEDSVTLPVPVAVIG